MTGNFYWRLMLCLLTIYCILCNLCCGLPDVLPQINTPFVTSSSATSYTLKSSDLKKDGNQYGIYGIEFYYKIYKRTDATIQLNYDFMLFSSTAGNPSSFFLQRGFFRCASGVKPKTDKFVVPLFQIRSNADWSASIDFSIGAKYTIDIASDSSIIGNPNQLYRAVVDQYSDLNKSFSPNSIDLLSDADLTSIKSDPIFTINNLSYGVVCFIFAQDFDWGFLPLYSSPVKFGPFDIN